MIFFSSFSCLMFQCFDRLLWLTQIHDHLAGQHLRSVPLLWELYYNLYKIFSYFNKNFTSLGYMHGTITIDGMSACKTYLARSTAFIWRDFLWDKRVIIFTCLSSPISTFWLFGKMQEMLKKLWASNPMQLSLGNTLFTVAVKTALAWGRNTTIWYETNVVM